MVDKQVWTAKYEPDNLDDMVLNPVVRNQLENILREPKNVILYGSTGVGKGTFTNILLRETNADALHINASSETGIDVIRDKVKPFAYAASKNNWFDTNISNRNERSENFRYLKVVVFNEAECLSQEAKQSLRELMEQVERTCKFIFMTNNITKFDNAIQSRCNLVVIKEPSKPEIIRYAENILNIEGIQFESGILTTYVNKHYPDIRKIIKELQANCHNGELKSDNIVSIDESLNKVLIDLRLHMAFYNIDKKEIYEQLINQVQLPVSQRQFYDLIRNNSTNKVSESKKNEFIRIVIENIPVKDWFNEYLALIE